MKTQRLYSYLTLAALISIWSCTSSRQTAQNAGDVDDLYGSAGSSPVYASNSDAYSGQSSRPQQFGRQQRTNRNANPDYNDEQQGYNSNTDEYYTELSARKLNRGLSPDPGWNDDNSYNSGFVNGYNAATASAYSWNRWGFNNTGFYSGLGLGLGMGAFGYGYPGFRLGFGNPFYSPFGYGSAFAYSPFGYGSFYDPFYSSYAYGWGGYNSFYSPFYGYGSYGGFYGSPVYVNNVYVTGADPYRNRTYNRTFERSAGRYTSGFDNSTRTYNPNGGRASATTSGATGSRGDGYYARPSNGSSRGNYYYDNSSSGNGRVSSGATAPAYNSNSGSSEYYARPRESSRGSYTPSGSSSGGRSSYQPNYSQQNSGYSQPNRGSYQQSQPSFSQPSQPNFSQPSRGSYQQSTPSFSAPSGGGGGGFSGGGGHSSGGGRGPR
ncbi:hypothetical protein GCM10028805_50500 [Spirosoma harenae]